MTPRALLVSSSLALLLTHALPAFAAEASVTIPCKDKTGRAMGLCIADTLKGWSKAHHEYHDVEEDEHTKWHRANDILGLTAEHVKAHRNYHTERNERHKVFHNDQREMHKLLKSEQDKLLKTHSQQPSGWSATHEETKAAQEKCKVQKDTTGRRMCIRVLLHPQVSKLRLRLQQKTQ